MEMERIIGVMLRWCLTLTALITAWAMRFGRWTQNQIIMHKASKSVSIAPQSARGVPALVPAPSVPAALVPSAPAAFAAMPVSQVPIVLPTEISPRPEPTTPITKPIDEQQSDSSPDDLDWAGSLSHAAVAATHLSNVLAMVRAGWIVVAHERLQDASPALDAIEAFQTRTVLALAPCLEQMTEAQHAEFFSDFGADFPTHLQGIE